MPTGVDGEQFEVFPMVLFMLSLTGHRVVSVAVDDRMSALHSASPEFITTKIEFVRLGDNVSEHPDAGDGDPVSGTVGFSPLGVQCSGDFSLLECGGCVVFPLGVRKSGDFPLLEWSGPGISPLLECVGLRGPHRAYFLLSSAAIPSLSGVVHEQSHGGGLAIALWRTNDRTVV